MRSPVVLRWFLRQWHNFGSKQLFFLTASVTVLTSALYLIMITSVAWERSHFDPNLITNGSNGREECWIRLPQLGGGIYWTERDAKGICTGRAGVLVFPEEGGVWGFCKRVRDASHFQGLATLCGWVNDVNLLCYSYLMKDNSFCCNGCVSAKVRDDDQKPGFTVQDAVRTTVSSLIVSIVIHVAAYVQMLIATARRIVSVTMMAGVTFLLSGVFLGFALIVNQYKVDTVMNVKLRSLHPAPKLVLESRKSSVGWATMLGWVVVTLMALSCLCWIKLSNHFASLTKPKSDLIGSTPVQHSSGSVLFQHRNSLAANGHANPVGNGPNPHVDDANEAPMHQPLANGDLANGTLAMEDL